MAKTIEQLKAQSAEVKNASVIGENTATRVGSLFNDIVEHVEAYEAGQAQKDTEQSTSINAETARATAAETTLSERINQEVTERKAMDETIGGQLSNEIERAKGMELGIAAKLNGEIERAQEAENDLQEKITSEAEARDLAINSEAQARTQNDQLLSQAIVAEQERAEAAEQANASAIDVVVAKNEEQDQKLSELESRTDDISKLSDITFETASEDFIEATVDAENKILEGIDNEGNKHILKDLHVEGDIHNDALENELNNISSKTAQESYHKELIEAVVDKDGRIIEGIKSDGTKVFFAGIENDYTEKVLERTDYIDVLTDADGRIIRAVKKDGTVLIPKLHIPKLDEVSNVLFGKKYVAIGDSYTEGDYTGESDITKHQFTDGLYKGKNKVYPYYIGNRNNMDVVNMAISGSCITTIPNRIGEWPSISFSYQNYKNIPLDADYITIKYGSNDRIYISEGSITLGNIDSIDTSTFYGAWNVVLSYIIDNCPNAKIGFIITGHLTQELYDAEKAIAKKYGLMTLDFASDKTPYFYEQTLRTDVSSVIRQKKLDYYRMSATNTHPNDECQEYASTIIENFLRTL